jgi:glucose-6-phosphate isomerase
MIWGVNSFDQWGVELGKDMGNNVLAALEGRTTSADFDSSTSGLVQAYKKMQDLL